MASKKILLVDDSETVLMMEKMILRATPFELITAADGQEALAKAIAEQPDLILLDIILPGMDGFEICRRLRAEEATRSIPVIMVTTRAGEKHLKAAYEAGCNDYVTKPISGLELLSKIDNYIGEASGAER